MPRKHKGPSIQESMENARKGLIDDSSDVYTASDLSDEEWAEQMREAEALAKQIPELEALRARLEARTGTPPVREAPQPSGSTREEPPTLNHIP